MRYLKFVIVNLLLGVILTACAAAPGAPAKPALTPTLCPTPMGAKSEACALNPGATARSTTAALGPVGPQPGATAATMAVQPLNLDQPGDSLLFQVTFASSAADANIDLAKRAVLTTDSGLSVQPVAWKPAAGGGELSFPVRLNGIPLLANAKSITLTIRGASPETPERVFSWPVTH
jgi:hypothetical protein